MLKLKYYIIVSFILSSFIFAQQSNLTTKSNKSENTQDENIVFTELESYIKEGNVASMSKYFGQQTYFSLSNGISGYYSSNQAYYVLEDFFKLYKVTSFKFDHIKSDNNNSYATGKYSYDSKGKRNVAQVYVSIKKIGNNWNIIQLTIN